MGSARDVAQLSECERSNIALNIDLDSVAGGSRLATLTSGFAALLQWPMQTVIVSAACAP
jgi:ribonuclease PH